MLWDIYLHFSDFYGESVDKHTSPMDPMSDILDQS